MLFVDSNIWCYYFDETSKEHKSVAAYIDGILEKKELVLNTVIVIEVSHFLIKNLGSIRGKEKLEKFLQFHSRIEDFDYEMLMASIDMLARYSEVGIGGRDATILATMKRFGVKSLISHDSAFKKVDFIEVTDPVKT